MNKLIGAAVGALLVATPMSSSFAQNVPQQHQGGGDHRGDHRGGNDHRGSGGWDRGDHRDNRGGDRRGGGYRDHRDNDAGRVIGSILGGFLLGESQSYRFRYDDDYYSRRGYNRGYYDNWRNRDRGQGCYSVGYRHGCRTIYYSRDFMILNLQGEVYCYRRTYRGGWTPSYCPRNWYDY